MLEKEKLDTNNEDSKDASVTNSLKDAVENDNKEEANKAEGEKKRKEPNEWLKLLLPIAGEIIAAVIAGLIPLAALNTSETGENAQDGDDTDMPVQLFYNEEQTIERAQFDYVECTLTSDPIVQGFQVKVYPYISVLANGGWEYLPILGMYTQEQYSADSTGTCTLLRENIVPQLEKDISEATGWKIGKEYNVGCMLIFEHTKDNVSVPVVHELKIGQLSVPGDDEIIKLIEAYDNDTYQKVDMTGWPYNKEEVIEEIISFYKPI